MQVKISFNETGQERPPRGAFPELRWHGGCHLLSIISEHMGALLSCCVSDSAGTKARLEMLHRGCKFQRRKTLGLTETVDLRLREDGSSLGWRAAGTVLGGAGHGTLDVASMSQISPVGADGFQIVMADGTNLHFVADSTAQRDEWVAGVAELLLHAKEPPRADREGESAVRSAEAAATYWNSRQAEVDSRQKAADERKKKYARTGGEN